MWIVIVVVSDIGSINISELKFRVIWCFVILIILSGDINRVMMVNSVILKNSVSVIGKLS